MNDRNCDSVFTMHSTPYKFGPGVTEEVGYDLAALGLRRVLLVTDAGVSATGLPQRVAERVREHGITVGVYDEVSVEPTDLSVKAAIAFAEDFGAEGYLAIGGGSVMDTCKVVNLYLSHPAPFMAYLNAPLGEGRPVPGPLRPLVCIPTTAGTSAENTTVAIIDLTELRLKSGISHQHLRPTLALLDPLNTLTVPPQVTAASGADVLTHAIESYTNLAHDEREKPRTPAERPPYVGSNPISDIWCERAIQIVHRWLPQAVRDGSDVEARTQMMLATVYAGMGFSNAGVHLPHAMGYPIAGNVGAYQPADYPPKVGEFAGKGIVPHGMSTSLGAAAAFAFTAEAKPARHRAVAEWMGVRTDSRDAASAAQALREAFIQFMQAIGLPNGLAAVGYQSQDLPRLAEGTLKQKRLVGLSPRPVTQGDIEHILEQSLTIW